MKIKYTEPKLNKGKEPKKIPAGSSKDKELAKNIWYVSFTYNGKQYKIKEDINRIHDFREKKQEGEGLVESLKSRLANGYNPENPIEYVTSIAKENISLVDAINNYLAYLRKYNSRPKTISSYKSKLYYLNEALPDKILNQLTTKDIEDYIHDKVHGKEQATVIMNGKSIELNKTIQWTQATVKAAKGVFRAFLNWCITEEYITENPATKLNAKIIRSEVEAPERHIPFTKTDLNLIMQYLNENDPYTAFFCKFIYYTCLRPGEIVHLKLKNINLVHRTITVPISVKKVTKNTKADVINIEPTFFNELQKLHLDQYPKEYYITGNSKNIVGETSIGNNRPYKRFRNALVKLQLVDKGYDLYSFKHYSNIQRFNSGNWTLTEIMKANRHTSISMTETYMKNITRTTDIKDKAIPTI